MKTWLLLACFFASGFAGLLYQTAWTREFATVFGTSELSISVVLSGYMAGLALGAAVAGRVAWRLRRPVLVYGLLELGIGIGAFALPLGIDLVTSAYVMAFGGSSLVESNLLGRTLFQVAGAFLVMMPCAGMMGATLPLLARHAVRSDEELGRRIAWLYAANTAGALVGTLSAGFWLLPELGLRSTVYVGIAANGLVFLAAAGLSRSASAAQSADPPTGSGGPRWILLAMLVSGVVSFSYEVVWTRLLGLVIGGTTPAFSTMLGIFLLGIALGSALAAPFARTRAMARRGFVVAQLGAAVCGWAAFRVADRLPDWARSVGATVHTPESGAWLAVVLLPLTLCIGATLPFAVRIHARQAAEASSASARVYAWNTVGSIVGALATGLFALPALGFEGTVWVAVAGSLLLALLASIADTRRLTLPAGLATSLLVVLFFVPPEAPMALLRFAPLSGRVTPGEVDYIGVGRSATVVLTRQGARWLLHTNGLPEASIDAADLPSDRRGEAQWLGLLPVLARPDAERILQIGLGGGVSLAAIPMSVSRVDVVELEPHVLRANRAAADRRGGDPQLQPRVRMHVGDARGALLLSDERYDAIVSQPSHPWTSGASHLYTREFFELVAAHLEPDGVFVQWMGADFISGPQLRSLVATLHSVFPYMEVVRPAPGPIMFAVSRQPVDIVASTRARLEADPAAFASTPVRTLEDVVAIRAAHQTSLAGSMEGVPLLTDDWNPLANGLGAGLGSEGVDRVLLSRGEQALPEGVALAPLVRSLVAAGHGGRLRALIDGLDGAERALARGWLAHDRGRPENAALHFEKSLELDPDLRAARLGLLIQGRGKPTGMPLEDGIGIAARAAAGGDWEAVAARDDALAEVPMDHLLHRDVARLRVDWRLALERDGSEALMLVDGILAAGWRFEDLTRRVRVAAMLGDASGAWRTIEAASRAVGQARQRSELLELAEPLPRVPGADEIRAGLLRAIGRRSDDVGL